MNKMYFDKLESLFYIIAKLRARNTGSSWDIQQTMASLAPYTIEEAYEVVDAINRNNMEDLCDELGDLLLQIVYQSYIAAENNKFNFEDVILNITEKLKRRNPDIFGNDKNSLKRKANGISLNQWEIIKEQEKTTISTQKHNYLDSVSSALPANIVAEKLQKKAEAIGFDWSDPLLVLEKVREEIDELEAEIISGNKSKQKAEYGDVLFTLINLSRKLGLNFDQSLHQTNEKFRTRFNYIEDNLDLKNKKLKDTDITIMETLWQKAKTKKG